MGHDWMLNRYQMLETCVLGFYVPQQYASLINTAIVGSMCCVASYTICTMFGL